MNASHPWPVGLRPCKERHLVDCISGLPLYRSTTFANAADPSVVRAILRAANEILPVRECFFGGDKGNDVKEVYSDRQE